jgi:hypothetical protein
VTTRLALGERAATDASGPQPFQFGNVVPDSTQETLDGALSLGPGHIATVQPARENAV